MIREEFFNVVKLYDSTPAEAAVLWNEIEKKYSEAERQYHTLLHLENFINEIIPVKDLFSDWTVIILALAYHDVIYKASKSNNEEKSAELAAKRLGEISVPVRSIARCRDLILATKRHEAKDDETNLFTDADLTVLGSDPKSYEIYHKQIRKEYAIYPDFLYIPGRKKVLLHFLGMEQIYKTSYFRDKYETQARSNLRRELSSLEGHT